MYYVHCTLPKCIIVLYVVHYHMEFKNGPAECHGVKNQISIPVKLQYACMGIISHAHTAACRRIMHDQLMVHACTPAH